MGQLQIFPHQLLCFMFFLSFFQGGSTPTLQNQGVSCQQGFRNNSKQLSAKTVQLFLGSRAAMKSSWNSWNRGWPKKASAAIWVAFTCIYYMKPGYDRYVGIWKQFFTEHPGVGNKTWGYHPGVGENFESTSCEWVRRNTKCREMCQSPWTGSRPRMGCLNYWSPSPRFRILDGFRVSNLWTPPFKVHKSPFLSAKSAVFWFLLAEILFCWWKPHPAKVPLHHQWLANSGALETSKIQEAHHGSPLGVVEWSSDWMSWMIWKFWGYPPWRLGHKIDTC